MVEYEITFPDYSHFMDDWPGVRNLLLREFPEYGDTVLFYLDIITFRLVVPVLLSKEIRMLIKLAYGVKLTKFEKDEV